MAGTTTRGYRYPEGDDVWRESAESDGAAPWKNLADDVDADVAAVEAAAAGATSGVAVDLAAHEAATTSVHGIADTSALVTTARQVIAGTGLTGGGTLAADRTISIPPGGVGTTQLADDSVTAAKIAADAVGSDEIATDAVGSAEIAAGAVTEAKIATGAVTEGKIGAGAVTSGKIGTGAVGTTQIADDAVTTGKIAAGAVGTTDIADSAVTSAKIADGTIATADLADSAVTSAKIADLTIVNADISDSAAIDPAKINGTAVVQARTITAGTGLTGGGTLAADRTIGISNGGVGTTQLADGAVTLTKLAGGVTLGTPYRVTDINTTVTDDDFEVNCTTAPVTITLPSATGRAGRIFRIRDSAASGTVTITGVATIPGLGYVDVRSNGTAWQVIVGAYDDASVGLASYIWCRTGTPGWRPIAYDTGVRDVTAALESAFASSNPNFSLRVRRTLHQTSWQWTESSAGSSGFKTIYNVPTGFRTLIAGTPTVGTVNEDTGAMTTESLQYSGAVLYGWGWTAIRHGGHLTYDTSPATLPASLPGTEVTAPA